MSDSLCLTNVQCPVFRRMQGPGPQFYYNKEFDSEPGFTILWYFLMDASFQGVSGFASLFLQILFQASSVM